MSLLKVEVCYANLAILQLNQDRQWHTVPLMQNGFARSPKLFPPAWFQQFRQIGTYESAKRQKGPPFPLENFSVNSNSYEALTFGSRLTVGVLKEEWQGKI